MKNLNSVVNVPVCFCIVSDVMWFPVSFKPCSLYSWYRAYRIGVERSSVTANRNVVFLVSYWIETVRDKQSGILLVEKLSCGEPMFF